MKKKISAIIDLTRWREVITTVAVLSALGAFFATVPAEESDSSERFLTLLLVFFANFLVTVFAFMINDVEDAEDDAKDSKKKLRNPISAERLSRSDGYVASFLVSLAALVLFAVLSTHVFLLGIILFVLGFLYSWKPVRLKGRPFIDILSHGYFLAGGILLTSFYAFSPFRLNVIILIPFAAVYLISIAGDLFNEIRDYAVDQKAALKNTASVIGLKSTEIARYGLFILGLVLAGISLLMVLSRLHVTALVLGVISTIFITLYTTVVKGERITGYNYQFLDKIIIIIVAILVVSTLY